MSSTKMGTEFEEDFESENIAYNKVINRTKFHFGSIIGEGGFAVIREVRHILDDKWFALKENNLVKVTNDDAKIILNELHSLVRLSLGGPHSCIIKLHLAFRDLRSTYMVLDLLTAGDLRIYLGSREVFTERKAAFLMACVGSALRHMHQRKIIHRDLKPENILFDSNGFPYITDFGLSYCLPTQSRFCVCDKMSGTVEYFAPELFVPSTHYHGFESDFWSLGIILYEMLFRKRPCDDPPKPLVRYSRDTYSDAWSNLLKTRDEEAIKSPKELLAVESNQNFDELILGSSVENFDSIQNTPCIPFSHFYYKSDIFDDSDASESENKEESPLPSELTIAIPSTAFSNESISPQCVEFLSSLLDVRIHKRIGVGSKYSLFTNHAWFQTLGINVEDCTNHNNPSPITPDLNVVADKICAKLMKTNFEDENQQNPSKKTKKPLPSTEVDTMIGTFTYLSPEYTSLYLPSQTPKSTAGTMRRQVVRALSLGMNSSRTAPAT